MRISLRSKRSSPYGGWWQATVAHGGHRWSWVVEKKVLGFEWAFGEEESEKSSFSC